jgi:hypothetical protein
VVLRLAVREVQAHDVDAGADHAGQGFRSLEAGPMVATILVALDMNPSGCDLVIEARCPARCRADQADRFRPGRASRTRSSLVVLQTQNPDGTAGRRAGNGAQRRSCLLRALQQDLDSRQGLAFQEFQESAAAGGDVADLVGDAVLGDGGQRVAAAGDREGDDAMARARVSVPWPNWSNSNTPTGPFQTMVPAPSCSAR